MVGLDRVLGIVGATVRLALAPVRFVTDRVAMRFAPPLAGLEPGRGAIVEVDGQTVAAFRDDEGVVHAVSPYCTHLGCVVAFDDADREWRCPCHGSRFDLDGQVVRGPARRPLARADLVARDLG